MLESIKKLFNKLGFKHRDYEPPAKPRWKVVQIKGGRHFLYYQHKPIKCPATVWYQLKDTTMHNGRYRKVSVKERTEREYLFDGYISFT